MGHLPLTHDPCYPSKNGNLFDPLPALTCTIDCLPGDDGHSKNPLLATIINCRPLRNDDSLLPPLSNDDY